MQRSNVVVPATAQHPAQVQVWQEDVNVGKWKTINQSSAIPATERDKYLVRVNEMIEAVKKAREQANLAEATDVKCASSIFSYIFG
jgi:hypothetical protein